MIVELLVVSTAYVAQKCFDQAIKEEIYSPIRLFFFPKTKYKNLLALVLDETIFEFKGQDTLLYNDGKIPFYQSQELFDSLIGHILGKQPLSIEVLENLKNNSLVLLPTQDQLEDFIALFVSKANGNKKLKKLHITDNFQAEIFEISKSLQGINAQLETISENTQQIVQSVNLLSEDLISREKPVVSEDYVSREEEKDLWAILIDQKILLLTGISFCGKSQLAKRLSEKLVDQGYRYMNRNDISEADRFLRNTTENRVFVLEDPFGHDSISENPTNLRRVEELVRNLPATNKLIITSRLEIIKSINHAQILQYCNIEGHQWIDLTNKKASFLSTTWSTLVERSDIPEGVQSAISGYLLKNPEDGLLQVGQLKHLSKISPSDLIGKTTEQLLYLAKADSRKLSAEIINRGSKAATLFAALGLTATTNIPLQFEDLAYILIDSDLYASFQKKGKSPFKRKSPTNDGDPEFPKYEDDTSLPQIYMEELVFLQKRGFVDIVNKSILFTHPTYWEAARHTLLGLNIIQLDSITFLITKSLSCLSPTTTLNCARQFKFFYHNGLSQEFKDVFKKIAFQGAKQSIFPGVRDICLSFLSSILDDLPQSKAEKVIQMISKNLSLSDIFWHGDIPFIAEDSSNFLNFLDEEETKNIDGILEKLNEGEGELLSPRQIWDVLNTLHSWPVSKKFPINSSGMHQILNSDEAFIRGKVAFITMRHNIIHEEAVVRAILNDSHPYVVFEGIKGAIYGYGNYSSEDRNILKPHILDALKNSTITIRASDLITTFGIDYGSESIDWTLFDEEQKKAIWKLWAEIFPVFFDNAPKEFEIYNTGRFGTTLNEAQKFLSSDESLLIGWAFYRWIDKCLHLGKVPDTYEFGVIQFLLEAIIPKLRLELFTKIITHQDSRFASYSISWCMGYWDELSDQEKKVISDLLTSDRVDLRWLKAVCLVQNKIPVDIQLLLFGKELFAEEYSRIIDQIDEELLKDCLSVYCGHPQPFWYLGFHHSHQSIWIHIIKNILITCHPVGFEICVRELVSTGVNGFTPDWDDGLSIWETICSKSKNNVLLAKQLILSTAETNCALESARKLWNSLIRHYPKENFDTLLSMVVDAIESIQQHDPQDIIKIFGKNFLNKLLNKLTTDMYIFQFINSVTQDRPTSETAQSFVASIESLASTMPIKLSFTFDKIKEFVARQEKTDPSWSVLLNIPNTISENGKNWLELHDDHYEIENWVVVS